MLGHTKSKCYKKHGYPVGYKKFASAVHKVVDFNTRETPIKLTKAHSSS